MAGTEDSLESPTRHAPKQGRAQLTLDKIELAIKTVLSDPNIGRDRFTTAQVAELAGVSIGSVYRYFTDRTAMLEYIWPERGDTYLPAE